MPKKIKIKIDEQEIICDQGQTIMKIAHDHGIMIPNLCFHPDFCVKGNCRICVVEINGRRNLATACSTKAEDGMEVMTNTERVKKSRNLNIELIFAEHIERCPTCVWRLSCKLLELAERYKLEITKFKDRKGKRKTYKFANAVEIDGSQCVDCRNCLDACNKMQKINYLELRGKGINQEIVPVTEPDGFSFKKSNGKKVDCIYCGQCAVHCPVSAAQEQVEWQEVDKVLKDNPPNPLYQGGITSPSHPLLISPSGRGRTSFVRRGTGKRGDKVVVAQFAPSIRVSIGEEFGLPPGKVVSSQIVTALKEIGFDYVFDVNFGADITTIVEAEELVERLKRKINPPSSPFVKGGIKVNPPYPPLLKGANNELPMFTSCCPAWVKYIEYYRPDLIPNLTTARSPQIHSAGIIKTYWAEKMRIKPKDIVVVSIMPCTAKKFEAGRKELKINGLAPIDYVITTRELATMIRTSRIDFKELKSLPADNPLAEHSGAAAIYGASGGVMESALRTGAYLLATAQAKVCRDLSKLDKLTAAECSSKIEFTATRGLDGVKKAEVKIGGNKVRVAVINGIGNIKAILDNLKEFDYIEVMACPDGCIGGGGQPIPTTSEIRKKRLEALYKIDKGSKIRKAHENSGALKVLSWLKEKGKLEKSVLFTKYQKRS